MQLEDVKNKMNEIAAACHENNIAFFGIALQMEDACEPDEDRILDAAECVTQDLADGSGRKSLIWAARQYANDLEQKYVPTTG